MLFNDVDQLEDPLNQDYVLDVLLELRHHHGLLVVCGAGAEDFRLCAFSQCLSEHRAEHHCLRITNLLTEANLELLPVPLDPLAELGVN